MSSVRLRRLQSDAERLREFIKRHPRIQLIQSQGTPPERYQLEYRIKSLRQKDDRLEEATSHMVEISLPRNYPRTPPLCRMLTPVFHPNIAPHAICIGDHWNAGESLSALVARIGELLAYQSYNTKSPLNGEAARWTDQNIDKLPLDSVSMTLDEPNVEISRPAERDAPSSANQEAAAPSAVDGIILSCPTCQARLRVKKRPTSGFVRCPRCQNKFEAPAE